MRRRVPALLSVVALLFITTLMGAETRDIPLHDWAVPFGQIRANVTETDPIRIAERSFHLSVNAVPLAASHFVTVVPCRVVDTRNVNGPYGGPPFSSGETRSFMIPGGPCAGIPAATAYSLNFTIANYTGRGNLKAFQTGITPPTVSTLNFGDGLPIANAAIVPADNAGSIDVAVTGPTNVIIDINGYFVESSGIVSTHSFSGGINLITGTGTVGGDWQFVGGTDAVTLTAAQRITATASFSVGASPTIAISSGICYQPLGGAVTPAPGVRQTVSISSRQILSASATFTPGAGFFTIGACVEVGPGQALNNNDNTSGWFLVTN